MQAVALYSYQGATEEELCFAAGDVFHVINTDNQDWHYVRNTHNAEGYVPTTYIQDLADVAAELGSQHSSHEDDLSDSQTDSQQSELDPDDDTVSIGSSFPNKADARNDQKQNADVQTVIQQLKRRKSAKTTASTGTKSLLPDPLEGFATPPPGYTRSTLAKNYNAGIGRISAALTPELADCGIALRDLYLESKTKIRRRPAPCTIAFSIMEAKSVASPPPTWNIVGRHVKMAIFDKTHIKGNIHHVPAIIHPQLNANTWKFSAKVPFPQCVVLVALSKR